MAVIFPHTVSADCIYNLNTGTINTQKKNRNPPRVLPEMIPISYFYFIFKIQCLRTIQSLLVYSITWIHPSGASMCPIWIPVSVSYSFWVIGPIFSIPLGKQISSP